jgi:hypothetical protein
MLMFSDRSQYPYDDVARVWDNLVVATLIGTQNPDIELNKTLLKRIIERRIAGKSMLDCLLLPPKLFADLQRVTSILVAERFLTGILLRSSSQKAAGLMGFLGWMRAGASFIPTQEQMQKRKDGRSRLMRRGCHRFRRCRLETKLAVAHKYN